MRTRVLRCGALILLALTFCVSCRKPEVRHDDELKATLAKMRTAIASFHKDNGRYPYTLEELVPNYLPAVPVDPVTGSATTWRFSTEESVQVSDDFGAASAPAPKPVIIDVQSGAGQPYSSY